MNIFLVQIADLQQQAPFCFALGNTGRDVLLYVKSVRFLLYKQNQFPLTNIEQELLMILGRLRCYHSICVGDDIQRS